MIVRSATHADGAALAEVHAAAFDEPWPAEDLLRFAGDRGAFALVAQADDGAVAGFILCRLIAGEAEILTLAVRPDQRRRGIAAALVGEAAGVASLSAEAMFLEVAQDNAAAIALYARTGFEQVGRRRGYYGRAGGPAVDALVMRRPLNS
ncbi:MAG TPA: ribosomal protein S18-alanine N-acetyltransferase [Caulobacteraceae bacterium]